MTASVNASENTPENQFVSLESPCDFVAVVKLARPEARNALNNAVREQIKNYFAQLSDDPKISVIIITGGPVFAAGADIRDLSDKHPIDMMLRGSKALWDVMTRCPKPVIAAVNGYAWGGGCELAMHADIIIAGETASFAQPEVKLGIMPGAGGTQRLLRAVGKYHAMKILLTGKPIGARDALAAGLVSEVVADDQVYETALNMAKTIAALPQLAVRQIKEVVLAGQDAPLSTALELERKAFQLLFGTADQKEGMRAFLEKRPPQFRGQ